MPHYAHTRCLAGNYAVHIPSSTKMVNFPEHSRIPESILINRLVVILGYGLIIAVPRILRSMRSLILRAVQEQLVYAIFRLSITLD